MPGGDAIAAALHEHVRGHSLPAAFHLDPAIAERERERVWERHWLFAAATAELPEPGDFVAVELAGAHVLVVRGTDGTVTAVHSACRHRGMPVCLEPRGRTRRWVCPYHGWSYDLAGRRLGAGGAERELDLDGHDLTPVPVLVTGGLIFLWLGPDAPAPAEAMRVGLEDALAPHGFDRARVAHRIDYVVAANWKLVWENNRECWHCHLGHPEYVQANFDVAPDSAATRAAIAARAADHAAHLPGPVAVDLHDAPGLYTFPTPGRTWSANRTPLRPGVVTESLDGAPVADRLMGGFTHPDVGTLRLRTVPNFWCHASSDHAVLTRLAPDGPGQTRITVQWIVDRDASVDLDRMLPFWQLTSEQDWALCEANHRGVASRGYRPGPYVPSREANVMAFVDWYLEQLSTRPAPAG